MLFLEACELLEKIETLPTMKQKGEFLKETCCCLILSQDVDLFLQLISGTQKVVFDTHDARAVIEPLLSMCSRRFYERDVGSALYKYFSRVPNTHPQSRTLQEIFDEFDMLRSLQTREETRARINALLMSFHPLEAKFFYKYATKDMRIGLARKSVENIRRLL